MMAPLPAPPGGWPSGSAGRPKTRACCVCLRSLSTVSPPRLIARRPVPAGCTRSSTTGFGSWRAALPIGDKLSSAGKAHIKAWWEPALKMKFDDPTQEPPMAQSVDPTQPSRLAHRRCQGSGCVPAEETRAKPSVSLRWALAEEAVRAPGRAVQ
jgi:hypothetical protein